MLCLFAGLAASCGPIGIGDEGTDPPPNEDVQVGTKQSAVYQAASRTIKATRPSASSMLVEKINLVLANNAIYDKTVKEIESQVTSPLTTGQANNTCPYLTKSGDAATMSCRYLVDRALEAAMLSSVDIKNKADADIEQQHGAKFNTAQMAYVKGWANEAVHSGIDVGAVHSVHTLRQLKVCDQAPKVKDKAYKVGEQQGKALLEQTEKKVLPTIPKTQCNTDIIAATIKAEAKKLAATYAKSNPLCAGYKAADLAETVDLVKAEKEREVGMTEGMRQAYEALRVRLVSTWKCDPCLCYTRMGGKGPRYCFSKSDLEKPAKSPWWMGKVGGYRCAPDGATIRQKVEAQCKGYENRGWGGCCGDELQWLAQSGVKQCSASTAGSSVVIGSPVVLDLDGDGVRMDAGTRVRFDLAATGEAVGMPALTGADALLVMDRDGNGRIDTGAELFGNATSCGAARCTDGIEALAQLDDNGDGRIDLLDRAYGRLRLWRDRNHDGVSDEGELTTLAETGVRAIGLDSRLDLAFTAPGGSATRAVTFTRANGTTGAAHDVWFNLTFPTLPRNPRTSGVTSTLLQRLR